MPKYVGTVIKDKTAVHKTAIQEGNKIGNPLKKDDPIIGDEIDGKWMHITSPREGWILISDLSYIDPDKQKTEISMPPPKKVRTDTEVSSNKSEEEALKLARQLALAKDGREASTEELALLSEYNIYMVRKWGDPIMKKYSFQMSAMPEDKGDSNFQPVPLYDANGHGAGITNCVLLNRKQIDHLTALQTNESDDGFKVGKKLQWFSEKAKGDPYLWGDEDGFDWKTSQSVKWQAIVYGGQPVVVLGTKDILVQLPDHDKQTISMVHILLYDMDNPDERAIQQATTVRGREKDLYVPKPNGMTIRAPIWKGLYEYLPLVWLESRP